MKLTPLDIQQHTFTTRFRGYDSGEVAEFMEIVRREFEDIVRERHALREQLAEAREEVGRLREREAELQSCLLAARKTADGMVEQAKKEGELIVKTAEQKAERIVMKADEQVINLMDDIANLRRQRARLKAALKSVLDSHAQMLAAPEDDDDLPTTAGSDSESIELDLDGLEEMTDELARAGV